MDQTSGSSSSHFVVPTIIDVPELIVTRDDADFGDESNLTTILIGKIQFLALALNYTINLGNIWRFPALCYKHSGGAFLLAYSLALIVIGVPLFLLELAFGQYANESPITIWRISPAFEGIGYSMCLISALVAIYYNVINSYSLYYLFASILSVFDSGLSFNSCDYSWNSDQCLFSSTAKVSANFALNQFKDLAARLLSPSNCNSTNTTDRISVLIEKSLPNNKTMSYQTSLNLIKLNSGDDSANILLFPDLASNRNTSGDHTGGLNLSGLVNATVFANNCKPISAFVNSNPFEFEKIISDFAINDDDNNTNTNNITTTNSIRHLIMPTNEYFFNNILNVSSSINEVSYFNINLWICLMLNWSLVFVILNRNSLIQTQISGKLAIICLSVPYICFTCLFLRSIFLQGSLIGIYNYLSVDFSLLSNIDVWCDAVTQIFFSLSPCWGGIITLASMNKFHNNFYSDAMTLVALNYATSLLCGLICFATLGYMAEFSAINFNDITDKGLGFAFVIYSQLVAQMPMPIISAIILFSIIYFLGIMSQLTILEFVVSTIVDIKPRTLRYRKHLILMITCVIMILLSSILCLNNGFHLLQVLDYFGGTYTALTIGLIELIAISWVYGIESFVQDIDDMISVHKSLFPSRAYWSFMWKYLTPSVIFALLLFTLTDLQLLSYNDKPYPSWTNTFGLLLTACCLSCIPAIALLRIAMTPKGSLLDKITFLCKPSEDWGKLLESIQMYACAVHDMTIHTFNNNHVNIYISNNKPFVLAPSSNLFNINRHMTLDDNERANIYTNSQDSTSLGYDQESNDEDLKFIDGKASYIIPEEDEDDDDDDDDDEDNYNETGGLITNETDV